MKNLSGNWKKRTLCAYLEDEYWPINIISVWWEADSNLIGGMKINMDYDQL